uniref:G_PROTEIN_RECEP_F1_2 domain-containing protein n=1 Tax=Rhabditophanes sp. KR3021 TaxID=114890 RepID=A0AC35U885_9BILA
MGEAMLKACKTTLLPSEFEVIQYKYVFPIIFLFGFAGNTLNLLVLLSKSMRSQANILLSAMAFSDLAVITLCVAEWAVSYVVFEKINFIRIIFYETWVARYYLKNIFSMASCWFVVGVSIERFIGVRSPMHTRQQVKSGKLIVGLWIVIIISCATCYYDWVKVSIKPIPTNCTDGLARYIFDPLKTNTSLGTYIKVATMAGIFMQVLIPVIAVNIINICLIYIVRKRPVLSRSSSSLDGGEIRRVSDIGTIMRQEKKVTITVISILICFTLTQTPSIIPAASHLFQNKQWGFMEQNYSIKISILNFLIIIGKALNFVLFCSASVHFRRRTIAMLRRIFCRNSKKYSNVTNSFNYRQCDNHSRNFSIAGRNASTATSFTRNANGQKTSVTNFQMKTIPMC